MGKEQPVKLEKYKQQHGFQTKVENDFMKRYELGFKIELWFYSTKEETLYVLWVQEKE
ncbi:MAG: hypothetical protein ACXAC8_19670 [Candidatus Hodarchaeales archaeon]|jgi:hypothetical protein